MSKEPLPSAMVPRPRLPIVDKMCASCPFNADRGRPKLNVSDEDFEAFSRQARTGEFYCHETALGDPRTTCKPNGDAAGVQPHFKVCRGGWELKLAHIRERSG